MSREDFSIAVGSAGSATGLGALRSLRGWIDEKRLLACDTNPAHLVAASSEFEFHQSPLASEPNFAGTLAPDLAKKGITAFFPIHDAEVAAASTHRKVFAQHGIKVLAADQAAITLCRDKLGMSQVFQDAEVPSPKTEELGTAIWTGVKLHSKPRTGVGSHGAIKICNDEDLRHLQSSGNQGSMIVQPYVEGLEITIDAFCSEPGEVVACTCRERVEVKAGVSVKARLFQDTILADLTARVSKVIGLTGSFCHQVRGTPENGWQVIDVNPRVGGGTPMSVAAGYDYPSAHAAHFLNLDAKRFFEQPTNEEIFVVRSYQEHVTWPPNP